MKLFIFNQFLALENAFASLVLQVLIAALILTNVQVTLAETEIAKMVKTITLANAKILDITVNIASIKLTSVIRILAKIVVFV